MKNNIGFSRFGNLFAYLENILDRGVNFGVYTVFTKENIITKNRFFVGIKVNRFSHFWSGTF